MNERIKKLAKQAGFYVSANDAEILIPDPHTEDITEVTEKFAELIQKDMVEQCRDMFMVNSVSWNLLNEKLEHFEVGSSPNG